MRRYIPSLLDLQAFEATARHLSFTRAGRELHVTQSAISHHVAKLEALLGLRLFERTSPGLTITDPGRTYLERIEPLLAQLEAATVEMLTHGGAGGALNVACPTTFGVNWLIPRLPNFVQSNRSVSLTLVRYPRLDESWAPTVDAAIRFGEDTWPGLVSHYLMGREVVAICHPDLLSGPQALRRPQDLERATLLQHEGNPLGWEHWLQATKTTLTAPRSGPRFDPFSMLIKAAAAKLGVALVPRCVVEQEINAGHVAIAFDFAFNSPLGYHLIYPERRRGAPSIETLRMWLVQMAHQQRSDWSVEEPNIPGF